MFRKVHARGHVTLTLQPGDAIVYVLDLAPATSSTAASTSSQTPRMQVPLCEPLQSW